MVGNKKTGGGHKRLLAIASVMVFLAVSCSSAICDDDTDASANQSTGEWRCAMYISNNPGLYVKYLKGEAGYTDHSLKTNGGLGSGAWEFDTTTGYGPFNSFYAAFDSYGNMVCHLNPGNLKYSIDGEYIGDKGYNIMWVLPKFYATVSNGVFIFGSEPGDGVAFPAFNGHAYLAYGVYEASESGGKLYSRSGSTVATNIYSKAVSKASGYSGVNSSIWDYYQWQAYRMCALAAMGNLNSRETIGYGDSEGQKTLTTGTMDTYGAYYGTFSNYTTGVKLFLENTWGSEYEWVYGLTSSTTGFYSHDAQISYGYTFFEDGSFGGSSRKTEFYNWGIPGAPLSSTYSAVNCSCFSKDSSWTAGDCGVVGGSTGEKSTEYGIKSEMSSIEFFDKGYKVGTRLVFLFDTDTKAVKAVSLAKSTGASFSVKVDGSASSSTMLLATYNTVMNINGNTVTFTNPSGKSCVITATADDGYRLLGWYMKVGTYSENSSPTGATASTNYTIKSSITLTIKAQAISVLTVGTDGGGTLKDSGGTLAEDTKYIVDQGKDAISVSGNQLTFKGYKSATISDTKILSSNELVTYTVSATASTVSVGAAKDYRLLGWNKDSETDDLGAGSTADKITLTSVSSLKLTLDTQETATLSIPVVTGATFKVRSGTGEATSATGGLIFTLDKINGNPSVTIKGNAITLTGYKGTPDPTEIVTSSVCDHTVTATAVQSPMYRLVAWYMDSIIVTENNSQELVKTVKGTTSDPTVISMKTSATKTFSLDSSTYGGRFYQVDGSGIDASGKGRYLYTLDSGMVSSLVTDSSAGEVSFKGYFGTIDASLITGVDLATQKIRAGPDSGYRFWIWTKDAVSDPETAVSATSQSYDGGAIMHGLFSAQVESYDQLSTAVSEKVGLIEIVSTGVEVPESLALAENKDSNGKLIQGGPSLVLKAGTVTTIESAGSISVQSGAKMTIETGASEPSPTLAAPTDAELVVRGELDIAGGMVDNEGRMTSEGASGMIELSAGKLVNNSTMLFTDGAKYLRTGGEYSGTGKVEYNVFDADQLQDVLDNAPVSPSGSVFVTISGGFEIDRNVTVRNTFELVAATDTSIAEGVVCTIDDGGKLTVNDGATVTNNGSIVINGEAENKGHILSTLAGNMIMSGESLLNSGTLEFDVPATVPSVSFTYNDKFDNRGKLIFNIRSQDGLVYALGIAAGATKINAVEGITIDTQVTIGNDVELVFSAGAKSISNGEITVTDGGIATVAGKLTNNGTITTMGTSENGGLLKVTGELVNNRKIVGESGGSIRVSGYQDNVGGTLNLKNGSQMTIETAGIVHVDLDSEYEKAGRATLTNYGLLIIDVNNEDMLNIALEKAQEVVNIGAGQVRIDTVENMKIKGKIEIPNGVNLVITEDTSVVVKKSGGITVLDGGILTVNGMLRFEYGALFKINDGGTVERGPNGKIVKVTANDEEEEWIPFSGSSEDGTDIAVIAGAAAAAATVFGLAMFADSRGGRASVTFYSSVGGSVTKQKVKVPSGTGMSIRGRTAFIHIKDKEMPIIVKADPAKGHRFESWNIYDDGTGSWYLDKNNVLSGESSFVITGRTEIDAMFAEGENDGIRDATHWEESRITIVKGKRGDEALNEIEEERVQDLD